MTTDEGLYLPAGSTADGVFDLVVTPESAGWGYSSLRVLTLTPGTPVSFGTGDQEMIALPLSGGCHVTVEGQSCKLEGRTGVFDDATDFAYLPRDCTVELVSDGPGRTPDAALAGAVHRACSAQGLVTLTCGTFGNVFRFLPPLAIGDDLLAEGLDVFEAAFDAAVRGTVV